jgi:hypothetical protein
MMETLIKKYFRRIFGELLGNVIFILIIFFYRGGVIRPEDGQWIPAVLLIVLWGSFAVYRVIPVVRDFSYVRENRCERMTGVIVEHKRVKSGKYSHTYYPIIRDDKTLERIKLHLDYREAAVGRRYTILYLPHTKLATVEEEHFEDYVIE